MLIQCRHFAIDDCSDWEVVKSLRDLAELRGRVSASSELVRVDLPGASVLSVEIELN
jgi:hypothetical protein